MASDNSGMRTLLPLQLLVAPDRNDPDPLVLYHGKGCPDGFAAALAAWTFYEGRVQCLGLDHGQAAPASVQRVRGGVAITDGVEPGHQRAIAVVEEPAATVDQAAHHLDVGDRLGTTVDVGGGGGDESGGGEEAVGVQQQPTHLGVAAADGERDREGVVVAGEHAVLEVAQVRSDHDRRR